MFYWKNSHKEMNCRKWFYKNQHNKSVQAMFNIGYDGYSAEHFLNISYQLNNYKFRNNFDFVLDNQPDEIWCFGCSWTYGSGVHVDYNWPSYISKYTGKTVRNFGVPAAGIMTTHRLLKHWLVKSKHNPEMVYILGHFPGRIEVNIPKSKNKYLLVNSWTNYDELLNEYNLETKNKLLADITRYYDSLDDIEQAYNSDILELLHKNKIPHKILTMDDIANKCKAGGTPILQFGTAADLNEPEKYFNLWEKFNGKIPDWELGTVQRGHPGVAAHEYFAELFLNNT